MKMLEAMGIKPEELLTREAQTYPHRSYASSVESNRHDLDILTEALRSKTDWSFCSFGKSNHVH